ncbi:hypothetical protein BGZ73_002269 [Actinomortierella ambigua]|nr:hypothetical protein BGZ73_002269 [Actinomortierella ambigua]
MHFKHPLSMPEILQALGPHLDLPDVVSCARVNKLWHHTFFPFLYRTIHSSMMRRGLVLTKERTQYIHAFEMEVNGLNSSASMIFMEHCTALRRLHWHMAWPELRLSVKDIIQNNPFLQSIVLQVVSFRYGGNRLNLDVLIDAAAQSSCGQNLRELTLEDPTQGSRPPHVLRVLRSLPNLELLRCRASAEEMDSVVAFVNEQQEIFQQQKLQQQYQQHQTSPLNRIDNGRGNGTVFKLRTLDLLEMHKIKIAILLLPVLPALETLRMRVQHGYLVHEFPAVSPSPLSLSLAETNPKLRTVHFMHQVEYSVLSATQMSMGLDTALILQQEQVVARGLAQMREHSIEQVALCEAYAGHHSVGALLQRHTLSLRVLKLWYCQPTVTSAQLAMLLVQCPNLKELSMLDPRIRCGLALEDAVHTPWACKGLERLELAVEGVCRVHDDEGVATASAVAARYKLLTCGQDPQQCLDRCRALEEQFFRQLGQLDRLKTLAVGAVQHVNGSDNRKRGCLRWSLDHGLAAMARSPSLESLDLKRSKHMMTTREIQWMQTHFTRLKTLHGVGTTEVGYTMIRPWLWQATLTPLLYRDIREKSLERGLVVTASVAPWVRTVEKCCYPPAGEEYDDGIVRHCRSLVAASVGMMQTLEDWQRVLLLVERNERLQSLTIELGASRTTAVVDWEALLMALTRRSSPLLSPLQSRRSPALVELSIQDRYNLTKGLWVLDMLDNLPALRVFRLHGRTCEEARIREELYERKRRQEQVGRLKSNKEEEKDDGDEDRIETPRDDQVGSPESSDQRLCTTTAFGLRMLEVTESTTALAMALLEFLPDLEILRLTCHMVDLDDFPVSMAKVCPKLHTIEILHRLRVRVMPPEIDPTSEDPFINTVNTDKAMRAIQSCRPHSLTKIVLAEAYTGGPIIEMLVEHQCRSLQVLRLIMTRPSVTTHQLQLLLTQCPQLRDLTVIGLAIENRLKLQDAVRKPWVCTEIECLRIAMVGVCHGKDLAETPEEELHEDEDGNIVRQCQLFGDGGTGEESWLVEHPEACRELEHKFYKQLGKLKRLEFLQITGRPPPRGATKKWQGVSDTLSWTLDRGLASMASEVGAGQRLQALSLGLSDHWMGLAEVQWMYQHLPRLTKILGLGRSRSSQRDLAMAWTEEHWPSLELD